MHEIGARRPKLHIFGDQIYSKNEKGNTQFDINQTITLFNKTLNFNSLFRNLNISSARDTKL